MSGVQISIEVTGLAEALGWLNRLGDRKFGREGLMMAGGIVESQTRQRLGQEKRAPDGTAWAPWSPKYLKSRRKGHSMLQSTNALIDSIAALHPSDEEVEVGSNLVYAAIHQMGGLPDMAPGPAAIPAREYLGLSDANVAEIDAELEAWLAGTLP